MTFCANWLRTSTADGVAAETTTFEAVGVAAAETVDDDDGDGIGLCDEETIVFDVAPLLMIFTNLDGVAGTAVAKIVGAVDATALVGRGAVAGELDGTLGYKFKKWFFLWKFSTKRIDFCFEIIRTWFDLLEYSARGRFRLISRFDMFWAQVKREGVVVYVVIWFEMPEPKCPAS